MYVSAGGLDEDTFVALFEDVPKIHVSNTHHSFIHSHAFIHSFIHSFSVCFSCTSK